MENGGERLEEAAASRLSLEEGASLTEGRRPMLREGRGCPSLCPVEAGLVRSRSAVALGSAGLVSDAPQTASQADPRGAAGDGAGGLDGRRGAAEIGRAHV